MSGYGDMTAAWLAHAPPPPPPSTQNKARRSSSAEPLAPNRGTSFEANTQGGYLPPSSHSPEPSRPRRTSVSSEKGATTTTAAATSVSPVKRARSKVTSNPPAPSAFYNYQHQLQQQQQQQPPQQQYQQSVPMSYTQSESASHHDPHEYARERRGSAPVQPPPVNYNYPAYQPQPVYSPVVYPAPQQYAPPVMQQQQPWAAHEPVQQQQQQHPEALQQYHDQMQQHYYQQQPAYAPPMAYDPHNYYAPPLPQQQQVVPFPVQPPPPPPHPTEHVQYVTDLSRQSTASSIGSVRRPLPQPTRSSSVSSNAATRRDLPRPPPGASAPSSPVADSTRLPPTVLNRTESVRMAAEALMARGAPQRRSMRSALGNNTFSPPPPAASTRMPVRPPTSTVVIHQPDVPSVANGPGPSSLQHAYNYNPPTAQTDARAKNEPEDLAASMAKVTIAEPEPPTGIPVFSFSSDEPFEQPRRRRGSSNSNTKPVVPTISLPDDNDVVGPVISVSGPEDDDARSQSVGGGGSSSSSRSPSVSVSFSAEQSAKSQRATSGSSAYPYARTDDDRGASSKSVGNGSGCYACRKWIAGKVVHALNTTFHPGCFVCAHCSEALEHVAFYEHDGLPYCHFDYHELFSKRCFHCRTPIVDERYITVQDEQLTAQADGEITERCYHELHFFCANCGDPFMDPKSTSDPTLTPADENGKIRFGAVEFVVYKGYAYCEKCHVSLHKPRCKQCKNPILDDLISALGGKYHPDCFQCAKCAQPFSQTQFFVKDGLPYDQECYKILLRNMV